MVKLTTFGFDLSGPPKNADVVYDLRHLPDHSGQIPETEEEAEQITKRAHDGDHIAIGCREGQNRSVLCAHYVKGKLEDKGLDVKVNHRDLKNEYISAPLGRGQRRQGVERAIQRSVKENDHATH